MRTFSPKTRKGMKTLVTGTIRRKKHEPKQKNQHEIIRPVIASDFTGISDCYWKDPEEPWDVYSNPRLLKQLVGPSGFLLAEAGHRIVGFVHYRQFRKRPWFDPSVKSYGQILELHVKHAFHGHGIGTRLMQNAVRSLEGKGVRSIYTHTDETNKRALKLYQRLGFKPLLKTLYLKRKNWSRRQ